MVVFWILATLMTLVALAIVLVPMLRPRTRLSGPSAHAATLEVLRGQRQEIEADIAAGNLPAEAREEALAELVERAGQDLPAAEPAAGHPAPAQKPWIAAAATAVAIPALAFGLYAATGTPSASDPKTIQAASSMASDKELLGMVESLARKVRERPDDAQGWELLARSMAAMGRFPEAVEAYEHVAKLVPGNASILADWADALGMAQGRTLRGRPRELAEQALAIEPRHPKALALAGTAALDAGEFPAAMGYWQRLAETLPPDSTDAAQVRSIIEEVRQRAGPGAVFPPGPVARVPAPPAQAGTPKMAPAAKAGAAPPPAGSSVSGSVAVASAIASKVNGGDHVFVFARAEGGPRVPLAVVRLKADALPYKFALDDTQAMAPGMNISSAQAIRVEARISRSGNVTPQPGDLVGTSEVVKPGARDVKVVVDKVVP